MGQLLLVTSRSCSPAAARGRQGRRLAARGQPLQPLRSRTGPAPRQTRDRPLPPARAAALPEAASAGRRGGAPPAAGCARRRGRRAERRRGARGSGARAAPRATAICGTKGGVARWVWHATAASAGSRLPQARGQACHQAQLACAWGAARVGGRRWRCRRRRGRAAGSLQGCHKGAHTGAGWAPARVHPACRTPRPRPGARARQL